MKKILVLSLTFLFIFLIYLSTIDRKIYFLTLSSNENIPYIDNVVTDLKNKSTVEKYIKTFTKDKYRITDYINMINSNESIKIDNKNQTIKNSLIKADVTVLELGYDDIYSKTVYKEDNEAIYNYIDEVDKDLEELLKIVRTYSKEDVFLILKTNNKLINEEINKYMIEKLKHTSRKYKVNALNIDVNESNLNSKLYKKLKQEIYSSLFSK